MDIASDNLDLEPNQAVCFNCGNILTSTHQHDIIRCSCDAIGLDGENLRMTELKEDPIRTGGLSPLADLEFKLYF